MGYQKQIELIKGRRKKTTLPVPTQCVLAAQAAVSSSKFHSGGQPRQSLGLRSLELPTTPRVKTQHRRDQGRQFIVQDTFISGANSASKPCRRSGGGFPVTCKGTWVKETKGRPSTAPVEAFSTVAATRILAKHCRPASAHRQKTRQAPHMGRAPDHVPRPILDEFGNMSPPSPFAGALAALPELFPSRPAVPWLAGLQAGGSVDASQPSSVFDCRNDLVSAWGHGHFDVALDHSLLNVPAGDRPTPACASPQRLPASRPSSAQRLSLKYHQDSPRARNSAAGFSQMLATL